MKRFITNVAAGLLGLSVSVASFAESKMHKVTLHVDENDAAVMNMALNNVQNLSKYYASKGDEVIVELVAYGPGLNMFVSGKSPVGERIEAMSLAMDNVTFSACGNTHRKMSEKAGKDVPIMQEASMVPSGVVRLIELQEDDYAYIRP